MSGTHDNLVTYITAIIAIAEFIVDFLFSLSRYSVFPLLHLCPSPPSYFSFPFSAQIHANTESLFPHLHGTGLGLLCVNDSEEYCPGEGAPPEGDPEGLGRYQRCHLVHLVY